MPIPTWSRVSSGDPREGADSPGRITRGLLADASLAVSASPEVWPSVSAWMPRIPMEVPAPGGVRARIDVDHGHPAFWRPRSAPVIQLRSVSGWQDGTGRLLLSEPEQRISAIVEPAAGHAAVRLRPRAPGNEAFRAELFAGLTLVGALLLGRLQRTMVHAAAVVAPDGLGWLLVGGTFSGKTTTCVNLIRSGWDYLSDDHVVLAQDQEGVRMEGWPRRFNMDDGFAKGESEGTRSRVEPEAFGPGRWRRGARLGGILFPRVEAELPTVLEPVSAADSLSTLLQQSPWAVADAATAPSILSLLEKAALMPAFQLRLGNDSYRSRERLQSALSPALAQGGKVTTTA